MGAWKSTNLCLLRVMGCTFLTHHFSKPFAYAFIGRLASAFMLGLLIGTVAPESDDKDNVENLLPLTLLAIPVWVKLGIDSARKQGADKLEGIQ